MGLSLVQAKQAIERHLSEFPGKPRNLRRCLCVQQQSLLRHYRGAGLGDSIQRFPITGNETVLDAIANISGLQGLPRNNGFGLRDPLPAWKGFKSCRSIGTRSFPARHGDELSVDAGRSCNRRRDRLVACDTKLAKIFAPAQRVLGFTLLGAGTASRLSGNVLQNGRNLGGGGGIFSKRLRRRRTTPSTAISMNSTMRHSLKTAIENLTCAVVGACLLVGCSCSCPQCAPTRSPGWQPNCNNACFGYYSTCWRMWPHECPACPPYSLVNAPPAEKYSSARNASGVFAVSAPNRRSP